MYISGGRFPSSSIMNSKSSKLFFYKNNVINIFRTATLRSNFTGFYVKKECTALCKCLIIYQKHKL